MDSHQEFNSIAAELICSIDKTLPIDPVVSLDGRIFDRSAVDSTTPFYPSPNIKRVIEIVVGSGRVDEKYLGRWARRRKTEVEEAIEKAEAGDADSMVKVGERYLKGDGIDQDETKGYEWFCKASEKDHVVGTTRKADCLIVGIGVEQDKDGGHQILLDALADGDPEHALLRLWYYCDEGDFKEKQSTNEKVDKWYRKLKKHLSDDEIHSRKNALVRLVRTPSSSTSEVTGAFGTNGANSQPASTLTEGTSAECTSNAEVSTTFETAAADDAGANKEHDKPEPNANERAPSPNPRAFIFQDANKHPEPNSNVGGAPNAHSKPCFECRQSKVQSDFTASQWKRRVGTGKCLTCVAKSHQWRNGYVALQTKMCGECKASMPHAMFSPNQWRRAIGTGRCKDCIDKSIP